MPTYNELVPFSANDDRMSIFRRFVSVFENVDPALDQLRVRRDARVGQVVDYLRLFHLRHESFHYSSIIHYQSCLIF